MGEWGGPRESGKGRGFSKKLKHGLTIWLLGSAVYSDRIFKNANKHIITRLFVMLLGRPR